MKILDRYISKNFLVYFSLSLLVFASLFFLVDILQRSIKLGLSLILVKYALLQIPFIVSQMVPMACLIGSLFTLNTLAKNSELIAMHACGISLYRISSIILFFSVLIGILNFFVSDLIVPPTIRQSRLVLKRELKGQTNYQIFKTHKLWYRSKNAIYNINYFSPDTNYIDGIIIYLFDDQFQIIEQISAHKATFDGAQWTLHDGISITLLDDFPISHAFKTKKALYIEEKPIDLKEISRLETMSFNQLRSYIRRNREAGFSTIRHEVNLHAKIAYAIACLVMAFLAIPFSAKNPKRGGLAISSTIALSLSFLYWICLTAGLSFGYSGTLPPIVSAWITNILFAILGYYLLRQKQKVRTAWPF